MAPCGIICGPPGPCAGPPPCCMGPHPPWQPALAIAVSDGSGLPGFGCPKTSRMVRLPAPCHSPKFSVLSLEQVWRSWSKNFLSELPNISLFVTGATNWGPEPPCCEGPCDGAEEPCCCWGTDWGGAALPGPDGAAPEIAAVGVNVAAAGLKENSFAPGLNVNFELAVSPPKRPSSPPLPSALGDGRPSPPLAARCSAAAALVASRCWMRCKAC
mmetsp:Transcript_76882/g.235328  ORF Transcript_76882/g.235328 Transcript_76882/m.235328 type:complete len:214 (+) Transcript_76882:606-1247(+)